jgi:shikimate kinase
LKTSIALIGFMGAGKTAIGKVLAERLGKKLVEVDSLIVSQTGKSIPQIFQEDGEITFREIEIKVIKEIASGKNQVIDCGGGVVLNRINVDRLKKEAVIVWLKASPEAVFQRVAKSQEGRPLLQGKNNIQEVRALLDYRQPFYERAADLDVDTSGLPIFQVVKKIIDELKNDADFD